MKYAMLACFVVFGAAYAAQPLSDLKVLPLQFQPSDRAATRFASRGNGRLIQFGPAEVTMHFGGSILHMRLAGGNATAGVSPLEASTAKANYLIGRDRSQWRMGVGSYQRIEYAQVYRGIDVAYYGVAGRLEYDFRVAPQADAGAIRMAFSGARLRIDRNGDLVLANRAGEIRHHRPIAYQEIAGTRRAVAARYVRRGRAIGFDIGPYDRTHELVIDPVVTYAAYFGGSQTDGAYYVALDAAGNAYIAGETFSTDLAATSGAAQGANGGDQDIFVSKLDSKGALLFTTYLGGNDMETLSGLALDGSGNIYVAGWTISSNFPSTPGAMQTFNRGGFFIGSDGFVTKLDPTGTKLLYSTYLGGNDDELLLALAVDSAGNAYVTGTTASLNFPVSPAAYQKGNKALAAFVTKINPTGTQNVYSTYVGGSTAELAHAIAIDAAGAAYVAGYTASRDFPVTTGAPQAVFRGGSSLENDGMIFKLDAQGSHLIYSTFLGGSGDDEVDAIALDAAGNAYVSGFTSSADFPATAGAMQSTLLGPDDAFMAKVNPTGTAFGFATLFGGTRSERAPTIALDGSGNIYLGGQSTSSGLPVVAPSQNGWGGAGDGYVFKFDPTATRVLQGTYIGGSGDETVAAIALDASGNVFATGITASTDFPASRLGAQSKYSGKGDAFIAKLSFADDNLKLTVVPAALTFQGDTGASMAHQTVNVSGVAGTLVAWKADVSGTNAAWLAISPKSGTGTAKIDVAVNTAGMAASTYNAAILVVNQVTGATASVPVALTLSKPAPPPDPGGTVPQAGVLNAASFLGGPIAPGEMVTIFGTRIGPDVLTGSTVGPDGILANRVAETRVLFDGVPAPLIYVSATQISAMTPYAVGGKSSTVLQVEYKGLKSNALTIPVASCSPAIFTADTSGKGQASIANQDGSYNSKDNPADKGSIITFYATGEGQTDPPGVDGKVAMSVYPKPIQPVSVEIGGVNAELLYFGAAPQAVAGVFQLNVKVPDSAGSGQQSLVLKVGNCGSPANVTMAVR
ncbi:MAG TPA: SBBP repeat-containing protein [Bryobacteraceae bacterium]|jgi:uncharacterized protein (TIGR03437 family)